MTKIKDNVKIAKQNKLKGKKVKKNKKEFFEILERDYNFNRENKIDIVQLFLLYLCSFSIPGVAINYLFILESPKTFIDYLFCSMFILIGVIIFLMGVFFTASKIRINKKYGNHVKTEMISIIKKECSIDEIQEYYKKASYHFKKNVLEKIIRDEISKSLDLKGDENINEILYGIKEKTKIKIKNA